MPKDIFYAILKLVSGEEILSKVCAFVEDDDVLVVLDYPIIVNIIMEPKNKVPIVKVVPWVALTTDTTFVIKRENIITMTEVKDKNIIKIHTQYVNDIDNTSSNSTIQPKTNYVRNINEARKSLEKIYKSEAAHTNFD